MRRPPGCRRRTSSASGRPRQPFRFTKRPRTALPVRRTVLRGIRCRRSGAADPSKAVVGMLRRPGLGGFGAQCIGAASNYRLEFAGSARAMWRSSGRVSRKRRGCERLLGRSDTVVFQEALGTLADLALLPPSHAYFGSFGDLGPEEASPLWGVAVIAVSRRLTGLATRRQALEVCRGRMSCSWTLTSAAGVAPLVCGCRSLAGRC